MKNKLPAILFSFFFSIGIWVYVTFSQNFYRSFTLPIEYVNLPKQTAIRPDIPNEVNLTIRANGWRMLSLALSGDNVFKVAVGKEAGKSFISLIDHRIDNDWLGSDLNIIDINPARVELAFDPVLRKKVPVSLRMNINFRTGFLLASDPIITPDSIEVSGARELIRKYDSVLTELFSYENADESFTENIQLAPEKGVKYDQNIVSVRFDVQKVSDREFSGIPVEVLSVPPGREIHVTPSTISVGVRGGIDILAGMKAEDISVSVQYNDIMADTLGLIRPDIRVSKNIKVVNVNPGALSYIIKKF